MAQKGRVVDRSACSKTAGYQENIERRGVRKAVFGIGGRPLAGFHYPTLLSHTENLKQTLKSAIPPRYAAGGKGLHRSIDIKHRKALEQDHSNATHRRCLGHTLFSFVHAPYAFCQR